jgi:glucosamine-6-phosphate deaminase
MTVAAPTSPTLNSNVHILSNPQELGKLAAGDVANALRTLLAAQSSVRMIFAAAPSQSEMLHALAEETDIDWTRVEAFHMDEYVGLPSRAKQRFGEWLKREFFDHVPLGGVHLIEPGDVPEAVARQYAALLAEFPIDIVCLGIGMNGHIAFNDPPANFSEPKDVRVVELEEASRVQQVEEGLFPAVEDVPKFAVTLSIPRLLRAGKLFCCVPGSLKMEAVTRALTGPIDESSPASILRNHAGCTIYLDTQSAAGLPQKEW